MEDVELTLKPEGALVGGNEGQIITKSLTHIGGGEDGISDVPPGKYSITAGNKVTLRPLQIRMHNTGAYGNSVTAVFRPGYTGSTLYPKITQVK